MPGKGGIWPDQNSFSVPVEMPETESPEPSVSSVSLT
jgi:hypothetical protein